MALRETPQDLRTSRVRRQSAWPGNSKRIEAMESVEKIRSAEGEANAGDVLLDEFLLLMPMTSPRELRSGPPLLPGLMGVSV